MSKITKEELKELQELNQKISAFRHDIGLLSEQSHSLNYMQSENIAKQEKIKKDLEEKYGKIHIELKDGSYKEIKEEETK
tara:strand:+ start:1752 stop:1991 length:240 start_codon:yes stop_codon:yes gene_type:complete